MDASPMFRQGREIHVHTTAQAIGTYMGGDRSHLVCYRCGQTGHVRFQCLQYKIRLCQHFERGECNEKYCSFAHGQEELRTPWKLKSVRVAKPHHRIGLFEGTRCEPADHEGRKVHPLQREVDDEEQEPADPLTPEVS